MGLICMLIHPHREVACADSGISDGGSIVRSGVWDSDGSENLGALAAENSAAASLWDVEDWTSEAEKSMGLSTIIWERQQFNINK